MNPHATDLQLSALADGRIDDATQAHVERCGYCQARIRDCGPAIDVPGLVGVEPVQFTAPSEWMVDRVEPSQLWRVAWDEMVQLALVVRASDDSVDVLPVFLDPDRVADEWTALLDDGQTRLGFSVGIGIAHRFSLPSRVFDACVGNLELRAFELIAESVVAYRRGERPRVPTGPAIHSALDPRAELQASILDEFASLSEVSWYSEPARDAEVDFAALLEARIFETHRVFDLSKGASPSPEEIRVAAEHGFELRSRGYDPTLVAYIDEPRQSAELRRLARQRSLAQAEVNARAAEYMTERRLALAARGGDGSFDWRPLFLEFLSEA